MNRLFSVIPLSLFLLIYFFSSLDAQTETKNGKRRETAPNASELEQRIKKVPAPPVNDGTKNFDVRTEERIHLLSDIAKDIVLLASNDPKAAAELAATLPDRPLTAELPIVDDVVYSIAKAWGKAAPNDASVWAQKLPSDRLGRRIHAEQIIASEWAKVDARSAAHWAQALPDARERTYVLLPIVSELKTTDLETALALVRQMAKSSERDQALAEVAPEMAKTDPQAATALVKEFVFGHWHDKALTGIIMEWVKFDPSSAAHVADQLVSKWAERMKHMPMDGRSRIQVLEYQNTVSRFAVEWAKLDVKASRAWIQKLPPEFRDHALKSLSETNDK